MTVSVNRRLLLKAGLAASFVSALPDICFAEEPLSVLELSEIGPGARPNSIYKGDATGDASAAAKAAIGAFASVAIAAWGFKDPPNRKDISQYVASLPSLMDLKTQSKPSYLAEYESAAALWSEAAARLGDPKAAFVHLMFTGRKNTCLQAPRLVRARRFVFDEYVRHLVSRGGFTSFGFTNFEGFMGGSFYQAGCYRRSAT